MPKYKLTDDWNRAWKWASMRCMAAALAIQGAWEAIPDDLRANVPHGMITRATIALLVLGIIGRLMKKDVVTNELAANSDGVPCPKSKRKPIAKPSPAKRAGRGKKRPY